MSLQTKIESKLSESLKAKDKKTYSALRLVVAAIKDTMIAKKIKDKKTLPDSDLVALLKKMVKQRNDAIEMFAKANRDELVDKEKSEIAIIDEFLPQQLSEEETKILCYEAITKTESTSLKEIGKVIKFLKENSGSNLDISLASKILKEKLQK